MVWRLSTALSHLPATQRVGVLVELPLVMRALNLDFDAICARLEIDPATFTSIENQLPFGQLESLLLACAEASHEPDFGLIIGAAGRAEHLGVIGKLLASAGNLGEALRDLVSNHRLYVRGAGPYLMPAPEGGLLVGYRTHQPAHPGARNITIAALAFGHAVMKALTNAEPAAAYFSCTPPRDMAQFRKIFGRAQLRFDAEHFALLYRPAALSAPVITANREIHEAIAKEIAEKWTALETDFCDRVLRVLFPALLSGEPSVAQIAKKLQLTPRTLNRRLHECGTNFREILNAARVEIAKQMLRDTSISVSSLSQVLGYSEVSAFTRFFSAETGFSPTRWHQEQHANIPLSAD